MNEWTNANLGDLITYKKGFAFKSSSYSDEGDILIVRVSDTTDSSINTSSCLKISSNEALLLTDYQLVTEDIIIATVGSWAENPNSIVGKVVKVPQKANGALLNQNAVRLRSNTLVNQNYIYYRLKDSDFSDYLLSNAQGSANQASITLKDIFSFKIRLPSVHQQITIAAILSSLDDKIDLLHRQNKTLEAMAETLFRQWFIEEAQEDWKEGTLGDVSVNVRDAVKVDSIHENCKYIGLEHIERKNIALGQYGFGGDVSSNKYSFSENDILFGKLRPYFHKVCFASFSGICSTDILVIRPIEQEWFAYCLFAFFQAEVVEFANIGSGGTRMPRTDWETLKTYPSAIPDINTIKRYNNLVLPSIEKIKINLQQIRTLEKLRDTLLPKLMSGEARVILN